MSSESADEVDQKKKSRAIDAQLEEDSKRLRRECKILLLGESTTKLDIRVKQVLMLAHRLG
jgi:guanine nucleotide-binding protein G(i) subunit alpha